MKSIVLGTIYCGIEAKKVYESLAIQIATGILPDVILKPLRERHFCFQTQFRNHPAYGLAVAVPVDSFGSGIDHDDILKAQKDPAELKKLITSATKTLPYAELALISYHGQEHYIVYSPKLGFDTFCLRRFSNLAEVVNEFKRVQQYLDTYVVDDLFFR